MLFHALLQIKKASYSLKMHILAFSLLNVLSEKET